MLKVLILGALALMATIPSFLIAKVYLKNNQIDLAGAGTVEKFMEVAPPAWKGSLVTLNFTVFGVAIWYIYTQLL